MSTAEFDQSSSSRSADVNAFEDGEAGAGWRFFAGTGESMSNEHELHVVERDDAAHDSAAQLSTSTDEVTSTIVRSLQARLGERFNAATLAAEVEAEFVSFAGIRITQFVPIFVERRVEERLSRAGSSYRRPEWTLR